MLSSTTLNTLRPRQNGRDFPDGIFKCIFLNEHIWISIKILFKFVPKGPINNNPALFQIMAWRRSDHEPRSEAVMVSLLTHIWVTHPRWVDHFLVKYIPRHRHTIRFSLSFLYFRWRRMCVLFTISPHPPGHFIDMPYDPPCQWGISQV